MIRKLQEGGFVDEDELFSDDDNTAAADKAGSLDGELVNNNKADVEPGAAGEPAGEPAADGVQKPGEPAAEPAPGDKPKLDGIPAGEPAGEPADIKPVIDPNGLTGVEEFLTSYGVKGGIIEFEGGEKSRFSDLSAEEQSNVLSSLVKSSVPSIEEKFNLDDSEVNLLNTVRESGRSVEDFINDIVDLRVQSVVTQQAAASTDYENMTTDAMFVKHLKDRNPDITDEVIATELSKAKELTTYEDTVNTIKKVYTAEQAAEVSTAEAAQSEAFRNELEEQRKVIVGTVETITDVAGAVVSDEVKEYLLHDVMELNDNNDPILMEKIFSSPETMFKVNWFMNYGEDYIQNLNNYWKKEVSKASKQSYNNAINGMPATPTQQGSSAPGKNDKVPSASDPNPASKFGKVVTEEDLFEIE